MCTWHDLVARNSKNDGSEIANACHFLLCLADPRGVCIENHPTHFFIWHTVQDLLPNQQMHVSLAICSHHPSGTRVGVVFIGAACSPTPGWFKCAAPC